MLLGWAFARDGAEPRADEVHDVWRRVEQSGEPIDVRLFPFFVFVPFESCVSDRVAQPRTAAAAMLAYLRLSDVNNVIRILKPRFAVEAVSFGVWERLLNAYWSQFSSPALRRRRDALEGREKALMKLYRMLRANFSLAPVASDYARFRWRQLHLLVLQRLKVLSCSLRC